MNEHEIRAKDLVVDALQEMAFHEVNGEGLSYGASWQLVGEADTLVTYKQPDPSSSSITIARTFGRVSADIDDIMGFYYSENSAEFLKVSQLVNHETHDARVLSVIKKRGPNNPYSFLGLKYIVAQPVPGIPVRDQAILEYMGFAQDSKGRVIGFVATLPLNPQETPSLGDVTRVPRVRVTNVLLVRALDSNTGSCAVFSTGSFDLRESSSNMNAYLRQYMENLRDLAVLMDSKRISSEQLLSKQSWVPDSQRKSCYVCTRGFGPTRHRHHCRLCGEVVCKKCLVARSVMSKPADGRSSMTKLKVCMFCVQKTRSKSATDKGSFGLPTLAEDGHANSSSPMSHTITSSMDRQSFVSTASSDASSTYSIDIGFEIRSPSRRYSDMSVASTIFEKDDRASTDGFTADLYIDTAEMTAAHRAQAHVPRYAPPAPPSYRSPPSNSSPQSSKSSGSSSGGSSGGRTGVSNNPRSYRSASTDVPKPSYSGYIENDSLRRQTTALGVRSRSSAEFKFNRIDEQLAEQQEILRQLALASQYNNRPVSNSRRAYS